MHAGTASSGKQTIDTTIFTVWEGEQFSIYSATTTIFAAFSRSTRCSMDGPIYATIINDKSSPPSPHPLSAAQWMGQQFTPPMNQSSPPYPSMEDTMVTESTWSSSSMITTTAIQKVRLRIIIKFSNNTICVIV